jgi:DNA polymerase III sliding clamp (beta) subunit (PCNA family)
MRPEKPSRPSSVRRLADGSVEVDRLEFQTRLEEVKHGLAVKEMLDQSSCFVFKNGEVVTFNEEVACATRSMLPDEAKGAVQAKKFLEIVRSLPDARVTVRVEESTFRIEGKNKRFTCPMQRKILIPTDVVERPGTWRGLDKEFNQAVDLVKECATTDHSAFTLTCVHIHPRWIEAFDNTQLARYDFKGGTGVTKAFLVKRDAIKSVLYIDPVEMCETGNWLHFRSASKAVMSIHRYVAEAADYQNLDQFLKIRGQEIQLPDGLKEAAERANIISSTNAEGNLVTVELTGKVLRIVGDSDAGRYEEVKRVTDYKGPAMRFRIAPGLLVGITNKKQRCEISESNRLRMKTKNFTYVACLRKV